MHTVLMSERELTLARVALFRLLDTLAKSVQDCWNAPLARSRAIPIAESYNEYRDLLIMLGKVRGAKRDAFVTELPR